jgi:hypothetical protein
VEHQQTDVRQVSGRRASADDTARFLRELRQLRDGAGLGHAELAARAHYPYDSIKAAEVGPALPDLPVLSAFVRGCGGTTEEWEERWRSLTKTPSVPLSEARHTVGSAAAEAGARIGSVSQAADNPDASIILAALNRVAEGMASGSDGDASPSDDASSWPDFPPDASAEPAADARASFEPAAAAAFEPDVPAGFEPGVPAGFEPGVPGDFEPGVPGDFEPGVPAGFEEDVPGRFERDVAASFLGHAPGNEPSAGGFPSGWDPIRVSTAWPAIPDSPIDMALTTEVGAEVPPWESAPWAGDPSAGASGAAPAIPAGWAKAPGGTAGHASGAAARSPRRAASRRGTARSSRTWLVTAAVVLLCVLAVVLAIFA